MTDTHIRQDASPNACAVGARSVAVTAGILDELPRPSLAAHTSPAPVTDLHNFRVVVLWVPKTSSALIKPRLGLAVAPGMIFGHVPAPRVLDHHARVLVAAPVTSR